MYITLGVKKEMQPFLVKKTEESKISKIWKTIPVGVYELLEDHTAAQVLADILSDRYLQVISSKVRHSRNFFLSLIADVEKCQQIPCFAQLSNLFL